MNEREQKQVFEERKIIKRRAIIISLAVMLFVVAIVTALSLFIPIWSKAVPPEVSNNESSVAETPSAAESSSDTISAEDSSNAPESSAAGESSSATDTSSTPPADTSDTVSELSDFTYGWIINNMGYTFIYDNAGLQQFNGTKSQASRYTTALNSVASSLDENVKVFSMLIPTHVEFVYDFIPATVKQYEDFYCSSQNAFITNAEAETAERVIDVNVYDRISLNTDQYLFFNTDINWTSRAAYLAYTDFAEKAGFVPVGLDVCTLEKKDSFLGRFYNATSAGADPDSEKAATILYENKDYIEYFKIPSYDKTSVIFRSKGLSYKNYTLVGNNTGGGSGYNLFLGREGEQFEIKTANENGKTLVVVGGSCAAPMLQFLANDYSVIHYLNPNYYSGDLSAFVKSVNADELLFVNYCTDACTPDCAEKLAALSPAVDTTSTEASNG